MKLHFWATAATVLALLAASPGAALAQSSQAADFIVALVNSEPITNAELQAQIKLLSEQRAQQRQPVPPAAELRSAVLERMINERAQLQVARDMGLRAEPGAIDQAEANLAAQNQMDLAQFRQTLEQRGMAQSAFRAQLRAAPDSAELHRLITEWTP